MMAAASSNATAAIPIRRILTKRMAQLSSSAKGAGMGGGAVAGKGKAARGGGVGGRRGRGPRRGPAGGGGGGEGRGGGRGFAQFGPGGHRRPPPAIFAVAEDRRAEHEAMRAQLM